MIVVDYAFPPHPTTRQLLDAGAAGVVRYLSWLPNSKVIDQSEYRALRAAGLGVALVWECSARDWAGGPDAGSLHAAEAVRQATLLEHPHAAGIYGAADWDMSLAEWDRAGRGYAQAFSAGIRPAGYRCGVYGPADVLTWCRNLGGFGLYWQAGMSTAWSAGRNASSWSGANLRQRRPTTIGAADCDINDAAADWGASPPTTTDLDDGDDTMATFMQYVQPDGTPHPAVFLTDGITARWIPDEETLVDLAWLGQEGSYRICLAEHRDNVVHVGGVPVRQVGRKSLIGAVVGPVPDGWDAA